MLTNGLSRVVPTHIHFGEEEIPLRGDGSIKRKICLIDRIATHSGSGAGAPQHSSSFIIEISHIPLILVSFNEFHYFLMIQVCTTRTKAVTAHSSPSILAYHG